MVISASDNSSASFADEFGNVVLKNPLVDAANGQDAHADYNHISVNIIKNKVKLHYQYPEEEDTQPIDQSSQHAGISSRYFMSCFVSHYVCKFCSYPINS